jgi:hypothetical protein
MKENIISTICRPRRPYRLPSAMLGRPVFPAFAGFSFTEVMVAVLIIGAGIIPIFLVFSRGNVGTTMTRDEMTAQAYAEELLDYGTALGYEHLKEGATLEAEFPGLTPADTKFSRVLHVQSVLPSGGWKNWPMAYKVLSANIEWHSGGTKQSFVLTGLVYQGKP